MAGTVQHGKPTIAAKPSSGGLIESEIQQVRKIVHDERRVLSRIPLFLPLLGTFGLVTLFYGIEKVLDQTPFVDQPLILIVLGIFLLLLTGAAAQKL